MTTEDYKTTPSSVWILRSWSNKIIVYAKSSFNTRNSLIFAPDVPHTILKIQAEFWNNFNLDKFRHCVSRL